LAIISENWKKQMAEVISTRAEHWSIHDIEKLDDFPDF